MGKRYHQIIALILAVIFVTACTSATQATAPSTVIPPTPALTVSAPTNLPATVTPTVTPTIIPPMSTALSATATNSPPATMPATEEAEGDTNQNNSNVMETNHMNIQVGDHIITATLVDNTSAAALKEALAEGSITINMRDYESMEKVGSLGMELPRNDEQITTEAGDIILYQGSAFVIYYAPNSWNFTRLGKIDGVSAAELKAILGDGNVTITLSLTQA